MSTLMPEVQRALPPLDGTFCRDLSGVHCCVRRQVLSRGASLLAPAYLMWHGAQSASSRLVAPSCACLLQVAWRTERKL